jgi:hypothetical protein
MQRAREEVRRRLVEATGAGPPSRLAPGGRGGPILDRWMARRLSPSGLGLLHRLEEVHGGAALAELLADALLEAGTSVPSACTGRAAGPRRPPARPRAGLRRAASGPPLHFSAAVS